MNIEVSMLEHTANNNIFLIFAYAAVAGSIHLDILYSSAILYIDILFK